MQMAGNVHAWRLDAPLSPPQNGQLSPLPSNRTPERRNHDGTGRMDGEITPTLLQNTQSDVPVSGSHTSHAEIVTDAEVLVCVRGLTFRRGSHLIFDDLNLDIRSGSVTAILGQSGSGKTTLLKLITGQLRPDAGTITVAGEDVQQLDKAGLFRLRRRMGMLFQSGALLTDLTVFENVAYPLREHTDLSPSMLRKLVLLKLEAVGLRGARDLLPHELSGGMARRVALARAIALDPLLLLYDEPFTGQDPISMGMLMTLIRQLNDAAGLTSILVSHDVQETASIADLLYVISEGRIIAHGTPAEIAADPSEEVRQFMDGLPDGPMHFHYPAPALQDDLLRGTA